MASKTPTYDLRAYKDLGFDQPLFPRQGVTKGDVAGHDFHGNQYETVGGSGATLTEKQKQEINSYTVENLPISKELEATVRASQQTAPVMYRGMTMDYSDAKTLLDEMKVGKEIDFPVTSWSESQEIGYQFAGREAPTGWNGGASVIMQLEAGAKGVNVEPYANEEFKYQKEWLLSGKFEVTSVDRIREAPTDDLLHQEIYQINLKPVETK